ncbi:hypothetical protein [Amycolatopsis sp. NPDC004625]|uniref:hypothetical protein n=1 Tax=Amycolatopsis sp. NPDC004625 TaxID=3154670 RepID=UPI0033A82542
MALDANQRIMRARLGAHALHSRGGTNTGPAREAFNSRFEREVDPDGTLPADERARRAEHARKLYFQGLAFRSSVARSKAKALIAEANAADAALDGLAEAA